MKQSRQEPVKGDLTAQTLQVNTFLPGNILKPVFQCPSKGCGCCIFLRLHQAATSETDFALAYYQRDVSWPPQFRFCE